VGFLLKPQAVPGTDLKLGKDTMTASQTETNALIQDVRELAEQSGVFGACEVKDGRLVCAAAGSAAPAAYRVDVEPEGPRVSLVMADRWLSESIEAELMHSGDSIEELLDEELAEQGVDDVTPKVDHYRSDDLLFTFTTRLPATANAKAIAGTLLAYQACFVQLGDMEEGEED